LSRTPRLLVADPAAELRAAHGLVAVEIEQLLAQHRHVEAGLQHVELAPLPRRVARPRRRTHLLDPLHLPCHELRARPM